MIYTSYRISDVLGFFTVDYQPKILTAWISGDKSKEMEKLSIDQIKTALLSLLTHFLKNFNITNLKTILPTNWTSKLNFRGSYTYRSIRSDELNVRTIDLAEPVLRENGDLALQFAGEATHKNYYGTVHGAVETGWREAQRIIDNYKK